MKPLVVYALTTLILIAVLTFLFSLWFQLHREVPERSSSELIKDSLKDMPGAAGAVLYISTWIFFG